MCNAVSNAALMSMKISAKGLWRLEGRVPRRKMWESKRDRVDMCLLGTKPYWEGSTELYTSGSSLDEKILEISLYNTSKSEIGL